MLFQCWHIVSEARPALKNTGSTSRVYQVKKWNGSGFRPPLCTYRLNWARRTSWGWSDEWDDTVLQTQNSKFEPWRSEAEHATSRSRRLPTILTFRRGWGRNIFCFFQTAETGTRTPNSGVKGSGANHYSRAHLATLFTRYIKDNNMRFYFPWVHRRWPFLKCQDTLLCIHIPVTYNRYSWMQQNEMNRALGHLCAHIG